MKTLFPFCESNHTFNDSIRCLSERRLHQIQILWVWILACALVDSVTCLDTPGGRAFFPQPAFFQWKSGSVTVMETGVIKTDDGILVVGRRRFQQPMFFLFISLTHVFWLLHWFYVGFSCEFSKPRFGIFAFEASRSSALPPDLRSNKMTGRMSSSVHAPFNPHLSRISHWRAA